jgi:hypothetical protein
MKAIKTKQVRNLLILITLSILTTLVLSSCVLWKYDTLLTERNRPGLPNLSGTYTDSNGQQIKVSKTDFSNTFLVSPPNGQSTVRVTIEQIEGKRYIVQGFLPEQVSGFPQYLFSVAEIDNRKIVVYFFPALEDKINELATQNKISVEVFGFKENPENEDVTAAFNVLTQYENVDDLINFVNGLFSLEGSLTLEFNRK